jgi:hypothetical protein
MTGRNLAITLLIAVLLSFAYVYVILDKQATIKEQISMGEKPFIKAVEGEDYIITDGKIIILKSGTYEIGTEIKKEVK